MNFYASQFSISHRARSSVSRLLNFTYTSRRGLTRGLRRRGGLGFLPSSKLSSEERFLLSLDLKGKTVYDVGGFIGIMTIFFASRAERVITYEPVRESQLRIIQNVAANGFKNVLLRGIGVSSAPGEIKFVYDKLMTGVASGDPEISAAMTGSAPSVTTYIVPVTTLDEEVSSGIPVPDFVKIDVEGMELLVLIGMKNIIYNVKPRIYIELHGTTPADKKENAESTIDFLRSINYEIYDIEKERTIKPDDPVPGKESHVFCK